MCIKRLVVHIGYPKTATSSLQLGLFSQLYHDKKIEYLNHLGRPSDYLGDLYCDFIIEYITGANKNGNWKNQLKKIASEISRADVFLISCENISFFCEDFSWAFQNGKGIFNAIRIKEVFNSIFDSVEILIGIRAQVTLIPSFYKEQYHHILEDSSKFKDVNLWLKANFFSSSLEEIPFNYWSSYKIYSETFGENNVNILIYEDLIYDFESYINTLAKLFCVELEYVSACLSGNKHNVSVLNSSGGYLTSKPTLNQIFKKPFIRLFGHKSFSYRFLKYFYNLIIPVRMKNIRYGKSTNLRKLNNKELEEILSKYSEFNNALIENRRINKDKMQFYNYIN